MQTVGAFGFNAEVFLFATISGVQEGGYPLQIDGTSTTIDDDQTNPTHTHASSQHNNSDYSIRPYISQCGFNALWTRGQTRSSQVLWCSRERNVQNPFEHCAQKTILTIFKTFPFTNSLTTKTTTNTNNYPFIGALLLYLL